MYWGSEGDEGSVSMEDYGSDYFDEMGSSSLSGGMSAGAKAGSVAVTKANQTDARY